ncbi:hypothetical protein VTK56DRAFT_4767 [Thermocarpiscus australiensis]
MKLREARRRRPRVPYPTIPNRSTSVPPMLPDTDTTIVLAAENCPHNMESARLMAVSKCCCCILSGMDRVTLHLAPGMTRRCPL